MNEKTPDVKIKKAEKLSGSEANTGSLLQEQKKTKPDIEETIPEYLNGNMKKAALEFAKYMRENKMQLRWAGFTNAWKAACRGKCICYVRLRGNSDVRTRKNGDKPFWVITPYLLNIKNYEDSVMNENLQDLIWDNMFDCMSCRTPCNTRDRTILGREFKSQCGGRQPVWVWDPDKAAVGKIIKLLELEKKARQVI